MPNYLYKARNENGELVQGSRIAVTERDLAMQLRAEKLSVFSIDGSGDPMGSSTVASLKASLNKQFKSGGKITYQDIAVFCRQLATLINAGVSILDAIEDISEMVSTQKFKVLLKTVATDVRQGDTLSGALRKHVKVFGKIFIALVAAGEKSGQLGKVLKDLSAYMENSVKLSGKVKSAMAYPTFVAVFFVVALLGMIFFMVPRFKSLFAQFGAELPLPTKITVAISDTLIHNAPFAFLIVGAIVAFFLYVNKTPKGKLFFDNSKLKIPIFGPMLIKIVMARFFQTLATLIKSGNDIVSSLDISAKTTDNMFMEKIVDQIKTRVVEGSTLSEELGKHPIFPAMVVRMAAVGEKSGQLDELFYRVSEYYNDEVDAIVASMSAVIEPVLIVVMGGLVGTFIITMYLPIFKIAGAVLGKQ